MTVKEYMLEAIKQAEKAYDKGEVPIGAIIAKEGNIIAAAHNQTIILKDATAHAEILAIRQACQAMGDFRLFGCTLYVTLEPCAMCAGAMLNAHLERLVFGAFDERSGACQSKKKLLTGDLGFRTEFAGGILEEECSEILRRFFKKRRLEVRNERESR